MRQSLEARLTKLEAAQAGPIRLIALFALGRGDGSEGWSIGSDGPTVTPAQWAAWEADSSVVLLTVVYDQS